MSWSAIIPLKPPGLRKTRLAARLGPAQRDRLAEDMFHHVAAILRAVPLITDIALLSETPLPGSAERWIQDHGGGLNVELCGAAKSCGRQNLLVIHADLPRLATADILELIADERGSAIAPDRHGTGTNALAMREDFVIRFAFGEHSFARHLALARRPLRVVERIGLALDVDTPDDLEMAKRAAFGLAGTAHDYDHESCCGTSPAA